MTKAIDQVAAKVFDGWTGHVNVGSLQQVSAPAMADYPADRQHRRSRIQGKWHANTA